MTSATTVSSGDSQSIAATETTHHGEHADRQRHHRQQRLHQLQVGDGPGDHLAGAQRVLALPVQPLHRAEDLPAQVVLHATARAARPGTGAGTRRRTGPRPARPARPPAGTSTRGRAGHRVVDGHPGQQRDDRLQAEPEHRDDQRPDRHRRGAAGRRRPSRRIQPGAVVCGHALHVKRRVRQSARRRPRAQEALRLTSEATVSTRSGPRRRCAKRRIPATSRATSGGRADHQPQVLAGHAQLVAALADEHLVLGQQVVAQLGAVEPVGQLDQQEVGLRRVDLQLARAGTARRPSGSGRWTAAPGWPGRPARGRAA